MKPVVIYRSKYGSAKRYAHLLARKLGCACRDLQKLSVEDLREFDPVIAGGGIYAGRVACAAFVKKVHRRFPEKRLLVFAVGASPFNEQETEQIRRVNFGEELGSVPFAYCRGAYDESIMSWKDRTLCQMLRRAFRKHPPENSPPWAEALCEADGKRCDWVDERFLQPLLEFL